MITIEQYAQGLYEALQEVKPADHTIVIDNFVNILGKNNDLHKFESIIAVYEKLDREARGVKTAELTLAREVELNSGILEDLNTIADAKLELKKKVDENILGGMIIKIDDTLIDASIRGNLNKLEDTLSQ